MGGNRAPATALGAVLGSGQPFPADAEGGGKVDTQRLTQVGQSLRESGSRMIPAYLSQAGGRSERNFSTWQGRLLQELRRRSIGVVEAANRFLREEYLAEFNRRFQVPATQPESLNLQIFERLRASYRLDHGQRGPKLLVQGVLCARIVGFWDCPQNRYL